MFNIDEDQTILQTPLIESDQDKQTISAVQTRDNFKLIKGKNDSTAFLPLGPKLGRNSKKREVIKNDSIDKNC